MQTKPKKCSIIKNVENFKKEKSKMRNLQLIKKKDREEIKLDTNYLENNYLTLVGKVTGEKKFSHEIYGEKFYVFNLSIPRLSGNADIIPVKT